MKNAREGLSAVTVAAALSACTAGSTGAPPIQQVPVSTTSSYAKLQFAVGTANLYGTSLGLNIVSTLRQPSGQSAFGVDTPMITGPFAFTAAAAPTVGQSSPVLSTIYTTSSPGDVYTTAPNAGPSLPETLAAAPTIMGTSQSVVPGTPFCDYVGTPPSANSGATFTACPTGFMPNATTFGQSGGVFAMGLAPYNHVANTGQSYSYTPYPQPFYDTSHPALVPWGGPPAFDPDHDNMGTRDGLVAIGTDSFNENYFLGVAEGITAFSGVRPAAGTYTLGVQVGTLGNNGSPSITNFTAKAQLTTTAGLPTVTAPLVTPDANGDGGAALRVTLPAGVTDAYVQIVDYGPGAGPATGNLAPNGAYATNPNCQGPKGTAFAPVYYTVHVTASGTYALPPTDGPNTNVTGGQSNLMPSPSLCTAAQNMSSNNSVPVNAGDDFTVQMVGFDYPAYAAALSLTQANVPQAPPITGPGGQADITLSAPVEEDFANGYAQAPLAAVRRAFARSAPRMRFAPRARAVPARPIHPR